MDKICPHCGASLPDGASFCPRCAESVNQRTTPVFPRHMPRKALYSAFLIGCVCVLALALAAWVHTRPRTYDVDTGELDYGGYHLLVTQGRDVEPVSQIGFHAVVDEPYRSPIPLYALSLKGGEMVADDFMEKVASITAEVRSPNTEMTVSCTEAQEHSEFYPDAAVVTFLDFSMVAPGNYAAEFVYTITMKNGDVIRMRQSYAFENIYIYTYTAQDVPMDTIEDVQALIDRANEELGEYDQLNLYLPAVVYEGGLNLSGRFVRLYGSVGADGQRTTFTGPTEISISLGVPEFTDIAFIGSGQGVGLRASGKVRFHLTNCRVSGWETGLLAEENAWINADETTFSDNGQGLCFDAVNTPLVSDNFYTNNVFQNNDTAVLLERVPGDAILYFPGTRFAGNGTDIDNRCGQPVDVSEAFFE